MKLLILPSQRLLYYQGKLELTLLPQEVKAEDYTVHSSNGQTLVAINHYKSIWVYKADDISKFAASVQKGTESTWNVKAIVTQIFSKKLQVIDLYSSPLANNFRSIIISDKFGDLSKIQIDTQKESEHSHEPRYINSNLGIPKYIKHISIPAAQNKNLQKEYLILGDQENRIKVFNSANPHELFSIWFMINMFSVECQVIENTATGYPLLVLLLKYENKLNLTTKTQLHYFVANTQNLQSEEYPGIKIASQLDGKIDFSACKFYSTLKIKDNGCDGVVLLYLMENKIHYEVFKITENAVKSVKIGDIEIETGKWDYLSGIDTQQNNQIIISYGCDVEMPLDIEISQEKKSTISFANESSVSLNKYQKIVKISLGEL